MRARGFDNKKNLLEETRERESEESNSAGVWLKAEERSRLEITLGFIQLTQDK